MRIQPGRVAVVTGGASGIGYALALAVTRLARRV
jgi:NAD(P)-dependent dehydrogenase (short-subunit alcohol dehydrogenase family)